MSIKNSVLKHDKETSTCQSWSSPEVVSTIALEQGSRITQVVFEKRETVFLSERTTRERERRVCNVGYVQLYCVASVALVGNLLSRCHQQNLYL